MLVALIVVGLLIAIGEFFAAWSNRSTFKQARASAALWFRVYRWRWLTSVPFAIVSAFVHYPMTRGGERWGILGFPFIVAAFDSAGRDYVGALTTPSMPANAVVWFFFPQIVLFFWRLVGGKKPQTPNGTLRPPADHSDV